LQVAPSSHTVAEIVNARWGRTAHLTFLFFCFCANIIVTSMLLLGGAATVEALTGMDYRLASFLIPWGIILYTASGGLQATFLASYLHTMIIFAVLISMVFLVYVKEYSSDIIYDFLKATVERDTAFCEDYFFDATKNETFFAPGKYACGPVSGNKDGSFLTMLSSDGLMFGLINIVGNSFYYCCKYASYINLLFRSAGDIPTFKKLSGFRQFLICGKTLNQKLYTSSTIFVTVVEFVWLCYVTPFYRVST
jgi:Na+/proline symporter